jgi:hypothetical protein
MELNDTLAFFASSANEREVKLYVPIVSEPSYLSRYQE